LYYLFMFVQLFSALKLSYSYKNTAEMSTWLDTFIADVTAQAYTNLAPWNFFQWLLLFDLIFFIHIHCGTLSAPGSGRQKFCYIIFKISNILKAVRNRWTIFEMSKRVFWLSFVY
jgi:hypothetical protein